MWLRSLRMPHPTEHGAPGRELTATELLELSGTMRALGSPGRLRLLFGLLEAERTVEDLAVIAGLEPSATSHHLRLLRDRRLVRVRRAGRHSFYALHDHHVADLLAAVRHHREHVRPPVAGALPAPQDTEARA